MPVTSVRGLLIGAGLAGRCSNTYLPRKGPRCGGSTGGCPQLRAYELMVICDGDLENSEARTAMDEVQGRISEIGEVASFDFWGLRDFAYEINHKTRGYYSVIELRAEPGAMDPVERYLRIADGVVRHKLIRLPDDEAQRRGLLDGTSANSQ